jgi:hypothetical protein
MPAACNREKIMKVCPVCNDVFADDLKFCDVDGTRLTRQRDVSTPQQQNKGWSLFGVALLVGALIISGISVIFLPRAHVSPPIVTSEPSATASNKPASTETASNATAPQAGEQPEIVVTEGPPPDPKKKEKTKAVENSNASESTLNPKAAAQSDEDAEKSKQPSEAPAVQPLPIPKKPDPLPPVRAVSEARDTEASAKPTAAAEVKKDSKNSKDSDKKKGEEKEKKKGGFFRVFKKIFGKD